MNYREEQKDTLSYKEQYVKELDALIGKREDALASVKEEYTKDIFTNPETYREQVRKMLGWPLVDYVAQGLPSVRMEKLSCEDGYTVYRMQFEILEGLQLTGLFFQLDDGKHPLVIAQHGGAGTPEHIGGVYGSTTYYHDMVPKVLRQGAHVFAPQLLLWNIEEYGAEYDRKAIDARLKRVGSSITAIELFGITRVLDYFEQQDYVSNFGMVGLSYGGFYTLYTTALDTRIQAAVSCAFFNQRKQYPYSDWTWFGAAQKFDDAEIACLIYPRKLCIELGEKDDLFDCQSGLLEFERLRNRCKEVGTDWLDLVVYDGIHEFCKEDEPLIQLVHHLKERE